VNLMLTRDEALVLFDWLGRIHERGPVAIEDQAELHALWSLEASLERILAEPFAADYEAIVKAARDRLRDPLD
jgi:hypothetical protein